MKRFSLVLILSVMACGGSGGGGGGGDDDGPGPDAASQSLDPAQCTAFAQSFANAATQCGSPLPAGAEQTFEGFCKQGVKTAAAMCGGNPAGGLDCFASADPDDWVCQLGEPYPACGGDLASALGALCVVALGNPQCSSGITCQYDADCSNGLACNSATGQCFAKNAYCIGLPCQYDVDCPSNEKCNSAEHACVGR